MATEDDRTDLSVPAPASASPWFGVTGLVLVVTLVAAIVVQAHQMLTLGSAAQSQNDYLVVNLYQAEIEYLRLREQWADAKAEPDRARERLQLRYDIFVSRIGLLRTESATRVLAAQKGHAELLRDIDAFVQRADLYFSQPPRAQFSGASLHALDSDLERLEGPLHQLLLGASHQVAEQVTQRHASIRNYNRVGLALTTALLALLALYGTLAIRRLRQVQDARRTAEALASRLQTARAELLRAHQARSEFLAQVSHEIRAPFHSLIGMLSLLQESLLDARQQAQLRQASNSAAELLGLVNDIVDLARLDAGALRLLPQAADPRLLLQAVEHPARGPASAKGLSLRVQVDPDVPAEIVVDAGRLRQILHALLTHAIRRADVGSVSVQARTETAGSTLVISIVDTGVAIDAAELQVLFEPLGAASSTRARHPAGPALEIARKLARLMGGDVLARSTPGEGNTFELRLPIVRPGAAADAASGDAPAAEPPRALQILVAEDHPVNRRYLASVIELLGHHGTFVADGWQAVQAVKERAFDLVLMDVHMPVMDGIVATETIRALEGHDRHLPIVALTADMLSVTRERCLAAGMQEVLLKPLGLPEVKALLVRHFGTAAGAMPRGDRELAAADAVPLIDPAALTRLYELMPRKDTATLFATMLSQAGDASSRMQRALRDADASELMHAAQGVKGAALNLGLMALAEAADEIHQHARSLNATALALALQRYDETLAATREICRSEALLDPPL